MTAAPDREVLLAVAGAHLRGQPLHHQLVERGARLAAVTTTAPTYRLHALATRPPKPGVVRVDPARGDGVAVPVEVYRLTTAALGDLLADLPQPMALGRVDLADGTAVVGFLVEPVALAGATDISDAGGWLAHLRGTGDTGDAGVSAASPSPSP